MVTNKNDNLNKIYKFFYFAGKLKTTYRFGATLKIKGDSSADHSWRLALMAFIMAETLKLRINKYHALKIALVHDLVEAVTGDVDFRLIIRHKITKNEKARQEKRAIIRIKNILPKTTGREVYKLWWEYEHGRTKEAKFIKALDKLETQIKLIEDGYKKWDMPGPIVDYSDKASANFSEISKFHKLIKQKLKVEFAKGNFEWKNEYDINI